MKEDKEKKDNKNEPVNKEGAKPDARQEKSEQTTRFKENSFYGALKNIRQEDISRLSDEQIRDYFYDLLSYFIGYFFCNTDDKANKKNKWSLYHITKNIQNTSLKDVIALTSADIHSYLSSIFRSIIKKEGFLAAFQNTYSSGGGPYAGVKNQRYTTIAQLAKSLFPEKNPNLIIYSKLTKYISGNKSTLDNAISGAAEIFENILLKAAEQDIKSYCYAQDSIKKALLSSKEITQKIEKTLYEVDYLAILVLYHIFHFLSTYSFAAQDVKRIQETKTANIRNEYEDYKSSGFRRSYGKGSIDLSRIKLFGAEELFENPIFQFFKGASKTFFKLAEIADVRWGSGYVADIADRMQKLLEGEIYYGESEYADLIRKRGKEAEERAAKKKPVEDKEEIIEREEKFFRGGSGRLFGARRTEKEDVDIIPPEKPFPETPEEGKLRARALGMTEEPEKQKPKNIASFQFAKPPEEEPIPPSSMKCPEPPEMPITAQDVLQLSDKAQQSMNEVQSMLNTTIGHTMKDISKDTSQVSEILAKEYELLKNLTNALSAFTEVVKHYQKERTTMSAAMQGMAEAFKEGVSNTPPIVLTEIQQEGQQVDKIVEVLQKMHEKLLQKQQMYMQTLQSYQETLKQLKEQNVPQATSGEDIKPANELEEMIKHYDSLVNNTSNHLVEINEVIDKINKILMQRYQMQKESQEAIQSQLQNVANITAQAGQTVQNTEQLQRTLVSVKREEKPTETEPYSYNIATLDMQKQMQEENQQYTRNIASITDKLIATQEKLSEERQQLKNLVGATQTIINKENEELQKMQQVNEKLEKTVEKLEDISAKSQAADEGDSGFSVGNILTLLRGLAGPMMMIVGLIFAGLGVAFMYNMIKRLIFPDVKFSDTDSDQLVNQMIKDIDDEKKEQIASAFQARRDALAQRRVDAGSQRDIGEFVSLSAGILEESQEAKVYGGTAKASQQPTAQQTQSKETSEAKPSTKETENVAALKAQVEAQQKQIDALTASYIATTKAAIQANVEEAKATAAAASVSQAASSKKPEAPTSVV
jgi:hypothetical protein